MSFMWNVDVAAVGLLSSCCCLLLSKLVLLNCYSLLLLTCCCCRSFEPAIPLSPGPAVIDTCFVVNAEGDSDQTAALFSVDAGDGVTLLLDREIDYQDTFTVRNK